VIRSPLVNNRSEADINFEGASNSLCNGPGSNWQRTIDNVTCEEVYTGILSWNLMTSGCGLYQTNYTYQIVFSGTILVHQVDILSEINNQNITRSIDTPLQFQIILPRNIEVNSTDPLIFAPIDVQAAITYVGYSDGFGVIDLFTTVQYPFILVNPNIEISNINLAGYININSTNNCPLDSYCTTTYEIQVNGTNGASCYLNGTYNLTFNIACNSLWTNDCPLQGNTAQIVFELSSGNLCGVFTSQVNISATLNTYASSLPNATTQQTFLENQIIYLGATVTSSEVSLVSTYVLNCSSIFRINWNLHNFIFWWNFFCKFRNIIKCCY